MYEINCENLLNALSQGHESSVWPQGCTMCSAEGHIYKIVICPDTKRTLKSVCGRRLRKGGGGLFKTPAALWHPLLLVHGSDTGTIRSGYTRVPAEPWRPQADSSGHWGASRAYRRRDQSLSLGLDRDRRANGRLFCGK